MKFIPVLLVALTLLLAGPVSAATYMTKDQALQLAFPDADQVETRNLFLTSEQIEQVHMATGTEPDSALYTFYVGKRGGEILGYAAIESRRVRTLPQTMLVVVNPDGRIKLAEILAFYEPTEYQPSDRWLQQFSGLSLSSELRIGGQIHALSGATLSAHSVARQLRKTLAMAQLINGKTD